MKKIIIFFLVLIPTLASAQQLRDIDTVAYKATSIGNLVIGLAISFAVLWIIINVVRYLIAGGSDKKKEGGMQIL